MFANLKRPGLLLDIFAFLIHLITTLGLALLAFMIQAPLFGIRPESSEVFKSTIFFLLAFLIFVADLFLVTKGTFSAYLGVFGITLFSGIAWSVWISPYDMNSFIIGYLVIVIPILIIKYLID